jgi:hypothetical protein
MGAYQGLPPMEAPQEDFPGLEPGMMEMFFRDQMGDVAGDDIIDQLAYESTLVGPQYEQLLREQGQLEEEEEEEQAHPKGRTPIEFVSHVNAAIIPGYYPELTPLENAFAMGFIQETPDAYVIKEGSIPKDLPEAKTLAVQTMVQTPRGELPLSEMWLGLPQLTDASPNWIESDEPLTREETLVLENHMHVVNQLAPSTYTIVPMPIATLNLDDRTRDIVSPFKFSEQGEGVIIYPENTNVPPSAFKVLAQWLICHDIPTVPAFVPVEKMQEIFMTEPEPDGEEDNDTEETEDEYNEDFRVETISHSKGRQKVKDHRLVKYDGKLIRPQVKSRGRVVPFRVPKNPLTAGDSPSAIMAAYPALRTFVGKASQTQLRTNFKLLGPWISNGPSIDLTYQKALYCIARGCQETGVEFNLSGYGKTSPYESALIMILSRVNCKYWNLFPEDQIVHIYGHDM